MGSILVQATADLAVTANPFKKNKQEYKDIHDTRGMSFIE